LPARPAGVADGFIYGTMAMTCEGLSLSRTVRRGAVGLFGGLLLVTFPGEARASLLSPELEDTLATVLAVIVLFVVPVVLIVLFWLVHILPEKIAHNRHHPQFEATRTLCLLSLVFGGLLWPLAWIWAYSRPVLYRMAYGTDTVRDAHGEPAALPAAQAHALSLQERLARLEGRVPAGDLEVLQANLAAIEARLVDPEGR